ncbi:hypothetical protein PJF56_19940 [Roseofilum sp. BLCC_M91]|uniref:Uncharacterized protein n=1 Tax=Roseofilum halophilum BLCC-M91 TaxID=3022259 RepID=A0ABT7BPQ0_9CYAN|nr:hypothetical protein [Roseofilum halophilum]MDJ1181136.1 hypothetical protein [Roseofilum halophilum BLCC-M91]
MPEPQKPQTPKDQLQAILEINSEILRETKLLRQQLSSKIIKALAIVFLVQFLLLEVLRNIY